MNELPNIPELEHELRSHLELCREIHGLVQREHQQLKTAQVDDLKEFFRCRNGLLERLAGAQQQMFTHKAAWMRLNTAERAQHPQVGSLIRQNLDLIMKVVLLDRENEKLLLHHRLVPAKHMPAPERQNPSLVARRYRANS